MVMINGRLYDSKTMNEIGTRNKKRPKMYFEQLVIVVLAGGFVNRFRLFCFCEWLRLRVAGFELRPYL